MKNLKAYILFILILVFSLQGTSQQNNLVTTSKNEKLKRVCEISLFVGRSYFGPIQDFKEGVTSENIITRPEDPYAVSQEPLFETSPSYFFEFKYNLNQQSGISVSRGTMDAFSFDQSGYAPRVQGGLKSTSINYEHSIGRSRHEFSTGISFMSLHMKSTGADDVVSGNDIARKVGLNFGYAFHIVESRGFFLAFHAQYNWAGTAQIGPYSIYEPPSVVNLILIEIHVPSRNTEYPGVKVHLDSFNIGFTAGFRFGSDVSKKDSHIES